MRTIDVTTQILLIVGGLNWLLVGLFQLDLVAGLFGGQTATATRIVFGLVGLSAIWQVVRLPAMLAPAPVVAVSRPMDRPVARSTNRP